MREFRSLEEVDGAVDLPPNHARAIRAVMSSFIRALEEYGETYNAEDDGFAALLEPGDNDETVSAVIAHTLADAPWEGAVLEDGCFLTCVLFNNEYGISVVVPDEDWVDPEVRDRLRQEL